MVFKLQSSKVGYIETEISILHLEKFEVTKQHFVDTCELYLTMLDTDFAHDP